MFDRVEVIYELFDIESGHAIKYFKNKYELNAFIQYGIPVKIKCDIRIHHTQPDSHFPSKAEKIKQKRDNLIDGLLNE